jgi:hypothetical protein
LPTQQSSQRASHVAGSREDREWASMLIIGVSFIPFTFSPISITNYEKKNYKINNGCNTRRNGGTAHVYMCCAVVLPDCSTDISR